MKIGPSGICEKLEEISSKLREVVEPSLDFLRKHSDRVERLHRAVVLHSVSSEMPISVAVLSDGSSVSAITLSDPFSRSPSPYRLEMDVHPFLKAVGEVFGWKVDGVKSGIFEFPPRTRFLAVVGPDRFLEKILFQERIRGEEIVSFAERVDEEVFWRIFDLRDSEVLPGVRSIIDDEGVHLTFFKPDWVDEEHTPLVSEMAKVIRKEMRLSVSKFSKVARGGKVLVVTTLPLDFVWSGDVRTLASDFLERLKGGYESFMRGAHLV